MLSIFCQLLCDHFNSLLSNYRTFSDVSDPEELLQKCYELCQSLAEEIAAENIQVNNNS